MPHAAEPLSVMPLPMELRKSSLLGAEATLPTGMSTIDLSLLSESDKQTLHHALFDNGVVVIRKQRGLDPSLMPQLGKFFDATAWDIHSGGEKMVTDAKNILSANRGARVPRAQQVSVIGKGRFRGHEGIEELDLKHVSHTEFHETPLSAEEIGQGFTRPYRWHMDAPLYERLPGFVTSLHAIQVPKLPDQKINFPNGDTLDIPPGATAFYSGTRAYELLSEDEKKFALSTKVRYAPRAYEWMLNCKAMDDALTIAKVGKEKKLDELPEWSWDKVHTFPMAWKNTHNGNPHLQVLGACVYELHTTDPTTGEVTVMSDLQQVRDTVHKLLSKVYTPENIYFHRWQEGDLVIFHNRGLVHSITGELNAPSGDNDPEKRLLWQCTMTSGTEPVSYQQ